MLPITVNWERSPSAPSPVFGYNTKQNYSPQSTDNIYDDGRFDKINPNVFMGKRASDGKLNFQQYGKMFSQSYNADRNNSAWESNVSWAGNTGMSKRANYQGESVNFDQELNTNQISTIITQDIIPRLNKIQMQYPQDPFSASAKSDTDIWNNINRYIWGKSGAESSPKGDWQADENAIFPRVQRNQSAIKVMENQHVDFQKQLNEAKAERDSIQIKLDGKAMRNHTHANFGNNDDNNDEKDCGWFGEKCWDNPLDNLIPSLSLTTVALGGLAAYFLLRKK
jgi:hypothetical protein